MATLWTIDRVLRDPNLLGAALGDAGPWKTWLAVLRAAFGLPLDEAEAVSFRQVAGDRAPPGRRVRELWASSDHLRVEIRASAIASFSLGVRTTSLTSISLSLPVVASLTHFFTVLVSARRRSGSSTISMISSCMALMRINLANASCCFKL
jgi:hypothetical protein